MDLKRNFKGGYFFLPVTSHDIFNMETENIRKLNQKLSKAEKKLRQKQMKARNTLLKHEDIECVSLPTKSLVIANGGLGNGHGELLVESKKDLKLLWAGGNSMGFRKGVPWEVTTPAALPPGLRVIEDVVSPEEEMQLLETIDWTEDEVIPNAQKSLKHRRVKHFGYEFRYDNNNVDRDSPLPGGFPDLWRVSYQKCLKLGYIKQKPDQLTAKSI
uniref:Uncharacterized protein n=1 Tax=Sphaerodactylus townsendi TaxID=933632 RepID=A0ACB8FFU5_9SAUR